MNVGSLFTGIGGIDLGLERAGMRVVWQCESDEYRRAVLRERFGGVACYEDVRLVHGRTGSEGGLNRLRRRHGTDAEGSGERDEHGSTVDLLCGGFPCQDLSVAGRRAGLAGSRSGLFFEFARICDALRPRYCLVENVPGLLSSNGGRDFGVVLGTLANIGYGLGWRILNSRFFGVPQRRRRVFILGILADGDPRGAGERAGQILAVGSRCPGHPATRSKAGPDVARSLTTGSGGGRYDKQPLASLSGLGSGGPDDNDGQQGRLVANTPGTRRRHSEGDGETFIAAPLSHGSNPNSSAAGRRREDDENLVVGPLGGGNDGIGRRSEDDPNLVAFSLRRDPGGTGQGHNTNYVTFPTLGADYARQAGGHPGAEENAQALVEASAAVRRLTPRECERLQGFPDHWTQLGGTPDSKRYAALGDAVTVNVAEWIGHRIMAA